MFELKDSIKNNIKKEIYKTIEDLKYLANNKKIRREDYDDILLLLASLYNYELDIVKDNEEFIHSLIDSILKSYKNDIEEENFQNFLLCGLQSGLGSIVYSLNILNKKHKGLKSFSKYINELFINMIYQYLEYVKKEKEHLKFSHYDAIVGASGYLYNIMTLFSSEEHNELKEKLALYLIDLTEEVTYKGDRVIGYHIKCENQYLASERKLKKDGHINFGLAHGIIGPLVALSKAKKLGYTYAGIDKSINKLEKIYRNFEQKDLILKYPTQLSYNSFKNNKYLKEEYSFNSGWCYGNLGIVRSLMIISLNTKNSELYIYYKNQLINILNQSVKDYNLESSCLCHGYSSITSIQLSAFLETKDKDILKTFYRNINVLIKRYREEIEEREDLRYDFSLIDGRGGIVLTLLSILVKEIIFKDIILI